MAGVGPAHRLRRGVVQLKEAGLFEGGWILEKTLVWALVSIAALLPGDKVTTRSAGAAAATTEDWPKVLNKWFKDRGSLLRMRIQLTISKDLKYREWSKVLNKGVANSVVAAAVDGAALGIGVVAGAL